MMRQLALWAFLLAVLLLLAVVFGLHHYAHRNGTFPFATTYRQSKPSLVIFGSNSHGFLGHAYVAFVNPNDRNSLDVYGQMPKGGKTEALLSLIWAARGGVEHTVEKPSRELIENPAMWVWVSETEKADLLRVSEAWKCRNYELTRVDCVAFANAMAQTIKLSRPPQSLLALVPRKYLSELIHSNAALFEVRIP
jgi:hypothetical protein